MLIKISFIIIVRPSLFVKHFFREILGMTPPVCRGRQKKEGSFPGIALPDGIQAVQDQGLAVMDGGLAGFADAAGQAAGGDNRRLRRIQGLAEPRRHPVDHGGASVDDAAVQAVCGVGAQQAPGAAFQFHLGKLGGVAHQGRQRKAGRRQNRAAHDAAGSVHRQQRGGGIQVHHDQRRLEQAQRRHSGTQQFAAQLGGVVHADADAAFQPRPHRHQRRLAHFFNGLPDARRQRGDNAGQDGVFDLQRRNAVQIQHVDQFVGQLVRAKRAVGIQLGRKRQFSVGSVAAAGDV